MDGQSADVVCIVYHLLQDVIFRFGVKVVLAYVDVTVQVHHSAVPSVDVCVTAVGQVKVVRLILTSVKRLQAYVKIHTSDVLIPLAHIPVTVFKDSSPLIPATQPQTVKVNVFAHILKSSYSCLV